MCMSKWYRASQCAKTTRSIRHYAGEFIHIGLSADTIHRGTTMFDRHPTQRPR
jgi:hypothetical protein